MPDHILFNLSDIYFGYEDVFLFDEFSLQIFKGEKLGIKGESGSGKTTLFRLLLGFEYANKGSITFNNDPYSNSIIHKLRKEVAWLPQDLNLGSGMTSDLIHFIFDFRANKNIKPEKHQIISVLEQLGLHKDIMESRFNDLSTGQRQRVGLACCYLLNKSVLLLDEPTSALDERSKEKVADLFLKKDQTVISTSHDPWWLEKCDRIIELPDNP